MLTRRDLLESSAAAGVGLLVAGYLDGLRVALPAGAAPDGYGPLQPDPNGLLDLPPGFRYDIVTQAGRQLAGRPNGLLYRFTPVTTNGIRAMRRGGLLEAMWSPGVPDLSAVQPARHHAPGAVEAGARPAGHPGVDPQTVHRRHHPQPEVRRHVVGDDRAYIVCSFARLSDGSAAEHDGQVWSYDPRSSTLRLEAFFPLNPDPSGTTADQPDGPDNITVNPWGGLVIAEDGVGTQHLVAVVDGAPFTLARNALERERIHRRELLARPQDAVRQHPGRGVRVRDLGTVRPPAAPRVDPRVRPAPVAWG